MPLGYQLKAENSGEFSWDYVERGPERFRVKIARVASGGVAGFGIQD
jgi:uncharacterized protein (DUF2249 family)